MTDHSSENAEIQRLYTRLIAADAAIAELRATVVEHALDRMEIRPRRAAPCCNCDCCDSVDGWAD